MSYLYWDFFCLSPILIWSNYFQILPIRRHFYSILNCRRTNATARMHPGITYFSEFGLFLTQILARFCNIWFSFPSYSVVAPNPYKTPSKWHFFMMECYFTYFYIKILVMKRHLKIRGSEPRHCSWKWVQLSWNCYSHISGVINSVINYKWPDIFLGLAPCIWQRMIKRWKETSYNSNLPKLVNANL